METITKYKAYNGTEFNDATECALYEARCAAVDCIISQFPELPKDDGCNFVNGGGYIQHEAATFYKVRRELLEQAAKELSHKWIKESIADETVDSSCAARIIGEGCNKQLQGAWHRISCTDKQFREWGQPYYASHPEDAKQIRINL